MPRRRPGILLALEIAILSACLDAGQAGSHGFALAKAMADHGDTRKLTATGTMYRALHRLEAGGLVENWWEDAGEAAEAGRPRRRLYRITPAGGSALTTARAETSARTEAADTAAKRSVDPGFAT
jgi:DNA-binding PadR family transcriptional regulator